MAKVVFRELTSKEKEESLSPRAPVAASFERPEVLAGRRDTGAEDDTPASFERSEVLAAVAAARDRGVGGGTTTRQITQKVEPLVDRGRTVSLAGVSSPIQFSRPLSSEERARELSPQLQASFETFPASFETPAALAEKRLVRTGVGAAAVGAAFSTQLPRAADRFDAIEDRQQEILLDTPSSEVNALNQAVVDQRVLNRTISDFNESAEEFNLSGREEERDALESKFTKILAEQARIDAVNRNLAPTKKKLERVAFLEGKQQELISGVTPVTVAGRRALGATPSIPAPPKTEKGIPTVLRAGVGTALAAKAAGTPIISRFPERGSLEIPEPSLGIAPLIKLQTPSEKLVESTVEGAKFGAGLGAPLGIPAIGLGAALGAGTAFTGEVAAQTSEFIIPPEKKLEELSLSFPVTIGGEKGRTKITPTGKTVSELARFGAEAGVLGAFAKGVQTKPKVTLQAEQVSKSLTVGDTSVAVGRLKGKLDVKTDFIKTTEPITSKTVSIETPTDIGKPSTFESKLSITREPTKGLELSKTKRPTFTEKIVEVKGTKTAEPIESVLAKNIVEQTRSLKESVPKDVFSQVRPRTTRIIDAPTLKGAKVGELGGQTVVSATKGLKLLEVSGIPKVKASQEAGFVLQDTGIAKVPKDVKVITSAPTPKILAQPIGKTTTGVLKVPSRGLTSLDAFPAVALPETIQFGTRTSDVFTVQETAELKLKSRSRFGNAIQRLVTGKKQPKAEVLVDTTKTGIVSKAKQTFRLQPTETPEGIITKGKVETTIEGIGKTSKGKEFDIELRGVGDVTDIKLGKFPKFEPIESRGKVGGFTKQQAQSLQLSLAKENLATLEAELASRLPEVAKRGGKAVEIAETKASAQAKVSVATGTAGLGLAKARGKPTRFGGVVDVEEEFIAQPPSQAERGISLPFTETKPIASITTIPKTKTTEITIPQLKAIEKRRNIESEVERLKPVIVTTQAEREIERAVIKPKEVLLPKQIQREVQRVTPITRSRLITTERTRLRTATVPKQTTTTFTGTPTVPILKIPLIVLPPAKQVVKQPPQIPSTSFGVRGKRFGEFKTLGTGLTLKGAKGLGGKFAEETAGATFEVFETKGKAKRIAVPAFRKERFIAKGGGRFIERTKFRIDSPKELQEITFAGVKASKKARASRKGLGNVKLKEFGNIKGLNLGGLI